MQLFPNCLSVPSVLEFYILLPPSPEHDIFSLPTSTEALEKRDGCFSALLSGLCFFQDGIWSLGTSTHEKKGQKPAPHVHFPKISVEKHWWVKAD